MSRLVGTGINGIDEAGVEYKRLLTRSVEMSELGYAAENGRAFSWYSGRRDIDATDTMIFVKNLNDKVLHIDRIIINGSNVICNWEIATGSATTTPSGTAVVGTNLHTGHANNANVLAYYDETAVAQGSIIMDAWTPITNWIQIIEAPGIHLATNSYIQVDQVTESTSGSVIIIGHYNDA